MNSRSPRPTATQLAALRVFGGLARGEVSGQTLREIIANKWVELGGLAKDGYTLKMKLTAAGRAVMNEAMS